MSVLSSTLHEVEGLNKGDTMMLVSQENDHADTSQHMYVHEPVGVESTGYARQPILTLRIGSQQDRHTTQVQATHSSMRRWLVVEKTM